MVRQKLDNAIVDDDLALTEDLPKRTRAQSMTDSGLHIPGFRRPPFFQLDPALGLLTPTRVRS